MLKKLLVSLILLSSFAGIAYAEVQSPVYTDGIGRSHFLSRGGYSTAAKTQDKKFYEETEQKSEKKVSNVTNNSDAPAYKETFTYKEDNKFDYNPYTGADQGVNNSKTIYTDGLGRLHFFGRENITRY